MNFQIKLEEDFLLFYTVKSVYYIKSRLDDFCNFYFEDNNPLNYIPRKSIYTMIAQDWLSNDKILKKTCKKPNKIISESNAFLSEIYPKFTPRKLLI